MIRITMMFCLNIICWLFSLSAQAQHIQRNSNILFYQLNTANGLSDNYIAGMVVDKSGNLWVGSGEGLNMFNGKTVVKFFNADYPQLQNDDIYELLCDKNNRIWVLTARGNVTVIDEQRKFHRVAMYNSNKEFVPTRWMLQTESADIILLTKGNHFVPRPALNYIGKDSIESKDLTILPMAGCDSLYSRGFSQALPFDNDAYLFSTENSFIKVNYKLHRLETKYDVPGVTLLTQWNENELLYYDNKAGQLKLMNLQTNAVSLPFKNITDQHGDTLSAVFTRGKKISANQILLTTRKGGFYIYNTSSGQLINYRHNAADPTTVINNSPEVITVGNDGWIFLGATPNGVSYYNSNAVIGQQTIFQDRLGNSYDGYINTIATLDNDKYYISTSDNLIEWTRSTNEAEFINYAMVNGRSLINREEVFHIAFDNLEHLWVATLHYGIYVLDKNKKSIKHFVYDSGKFNTIPNSPVSHLNMAPDGWMWISTRAGLCRIHPITYEIQRFNDTILSQLNGKWIYRTWFSDVNNIWIATRELGLWHYDLLNKKLETFTNKTGLFTNDVLCVKKDHFNNLYVGTARGLTVYFTNGSYKTYNEKTGLLNKRVEALLLDKRNRMWMGNDVGLACFNIADTSLKVFDERYGLSIQGFRVNSYHQNSDDELIWGTEKGLQYFYPDDLLRQEIKLSTTINRVETRGVVSDLTQTDTFRLASSDNYVSFYFSSIDYSTHLRTFYE